MVLPAPSAIAELLKPITWFPPMWAFGCGVVASGMPLSGRLMLVFCGVLLAGPLVCATSQAVNDWFDRHVDAINEPQRPIPSGPPLRLKENGWWGNAACGLCYEGLAWVTGAAVMAGGAMPSLQSLTLAALYSAGAHGIMTLNDFKSIEGDRQMGVGSLPVRLGVQRAAWAACLFMALPQLLVVLALLDWQRPLHAAGVAGMLVVQVLLMRRFLRDPRKYALWYSAIGINFFVLGMLISAFALRSQSVG
jgi:chlorophyll synthase